MTKIIMSDTNSLRENSTQNTFLAIMFAVAYSIGPVISQVTGLRSGSGGRPHRCELALVLWNQSARLRRRTCHFLHPPPEASSFVGL